MTKLLEIALAKAAKLSEAEQDRIARLVLDETLDEARWQATFAGSQAKLARLAERARGEIARGEIRRDDPSANKKGVRNLSVAMEEAGG